MLFQCVSVELILVLKLNQINRFLINFNNNFFFHFINSNTVGQVQTIDGHAVEFIISTRGNIQLVIDGHTFCQNEVLKKKTYFICCQTKVIGCPARARLVHINNRVEIKNLEHNHPVVMGRRSIGEATKLKQAWKKERRKQIKKNQKEKQEENAPDQSSD